MNDKVAPRAFISYSHDSEDHCQRVRLLADLLCAQGIEIVGDFYAEDIPVGGCLTTFMQNISDMDIVLCILTPGYKEKADKGQGGVAYEERIISEGLYKNVNKRKVIPVVFDTTEQDFSENFPMFIPSTIKSVIRSADDIGFHRLAEDIARAIHEAPKQPKPPLGANPFQASSPNLTTVNIDFSSIDNQMLFNTAFQQTSKAERRAFNNLLKDAKKYSFEQLKLVKDKCLIERPALNNNDIVTTTMDKFVNAVSPLFLTAFAGCLSFDPKFSNQESLLIDITSLDNWAMNVGEHKIQHVPELIAYVYHHIYGAILLCNDSIDGIISLAKQSVQVLYPHGHIELLKARPVTGHVESLGRDSSVSFKFLLEAYSRWNWLQCIFRDEDEYKLAVVTYQMAINILDYFSAVKEERLPPAGSTGHMDLNYAPYVPPAFVIADKKIIADAHKELVKNKEFFKSYLKSRSILEERAIVNWGRWLYVTSQFKADGAWFMQAFDFDIMQRIMA